MAVYKNAYNFKLGFSREPPMTAQLSQEDENIEATSYKNRSS
jgi:hypothetical protein